MSITELAARVGTTRPHISKIEHGHVEPNLKTLNKILSVLGLKLTILLDAEKLMNNKKAKDGTIEKELFS